ncbi:MAG: response regulator [Chitinophagaceae bacterium]
MQNQHPINVAIVDDHQIVIDGYRALLKGLKNIKIIYATTSPTQLLADITNLKIDVLITDCMMPEMNGLELSKKIKKQYPFIKILALSMSGKGDLVNDMINDADISGYVMKNIGQKELIDAIEKIASGGNYFADEILNELAKINTIKKENDEIHLTAREIEIIQLMEKEFSNKTIAEKLFISERTVETHRKNIFRKTNTNSLLGLIKYAYQHKLISDIS